jgi:hypothetical protein
MDTKKTKGKVKTVEINIALPSLGALRTRARAKRRWPFKKTVATGGIISVVTIIALAGGCYFASNQVQPTTTGAQMATPATKLQQGTPDYPTVLPASKSIQDLGGWTRVSPPDRNPVFAYADKIGNTPINVSQQPLPDDFEADADQQIQQLASGYKANEKITAGSISVHIGTSAKGPQSVIFNKDNLLVLIKSSAQIDNDRWAAYINSLK